MQTVHTPSAASAFAASGEKRTGARKLPTAGVALPITPTSANSRPDLTSCLLGNEATFPAPDVLCYYGYDHLSRMMTRGNTPTMTRRYCYDGWNCIAEYAQSSIHNSFTWGLDLSGTMQGAGGVGGLLVHRWTSEAGQPDYFPAYDGNGNVTEYLDTTGAVEVHYEYDPFGGLTRRSGTTSTRFQYRFSTKARNPNTGLYYYGYRWYNTYTGSWPSRDPIAERGGVNLYGFVRNDGVNKWDVLGLVKVDSSGMPVPAKIEAEWNSIAMRFSSSGMHFYDAWVECVCNDGKIICTAKGNARILLNWNREAPTNGSSWDEVYGHEQRHINAQNRKFNELITNPLQIEPDEPATPERADALTKKYSDIWIKAKLDEVDGSGHDESENGNPDDPRPRPEHPYPPYPGSPDVPPKPEVDPNPIEILPLPPLPNFKK